MNIIRDDKIITLTSEEIECAYREKLHEYRLQEAEIQFYYYLGVNPYETDEDGDIIGIGNAESFEHDFGYSFREVVNPGSKHYRLEAIVKEYERLLCTSRLETDIWQEACFHVICGVVGVNDNRDDSFDFDLALTDVIIFFENKDDSFFEEYGTTKETVLNNEDLLLEIADEHYRCVTRYGNDRDWSCENACTMEPGIFSY